MRLFSLKIIMVFVLLPLQSVAQNTASLLWTPANVPQARGGVPSLPLLPDKYSLYTLDEAVMRSRLNQAARGVDPINKQLDIPLPTGEIVQIVLDETNTMAPELAAKFPQIKTYNAVMIGRPSVKGVVDLGELGFHGMLFMENGQRLFIDPRRDHNGKVYYISYYDKDYAPSDKQRLSRKLAHSHAKPARPSLLKNTKNLSPDNLKQRLAQRSGASLRTFGLAVAATGEYTEYHGGTTAKALSAINTTIARVNQIYQRDVAVKFELVANNEQIIFTDKDNDPYTNNEDFEQLRKDNQKTVNQIIDEDNYDIGHVFTKTKSAGGGETLVTSLCNDEEKASAASGDSEPKNDPFDIATIAHELGHQLNAHHTFNGISDKACKDNRDDKGSSSWPNGIENNPITIPGSQWELGSGLSIMSYLNGCAVEDNVLTNAIAMFHIGNIRQINSYVDLTENTEECGKTTPLNNQAPIANAGKDYTIPAQTPFTLTGSATDADSGQTLTYSWEQMDLGQGATIADGDKGDNPLFRIFAPSSVSSRTFPQLSTLLSDDFLLLSSNTSIAGEVLPITNRELNFALSVRDQQGGVGEDEVKLTVINTGDAFAITIINPLPLVAGETVALSWEVASTDVAPISCSNVDILLSVDGGQSFATTLAKSTANDGREIVTIPADLASNTTSRLKVTCSDNIFFNISENLQLSASSSADDITAPQKAEPTFDEGNEDHVNYFRLGLSSALAVDVSVDYETRDGSGENAAKAGEDYEAKAGKATIRAGETELFIGVTIKGDTKIEEDETFSLVVSNPVNAKFSMNVTEISATHTIENDD